VALKNIDLLSFLIYQPEIKRRGQQFWEMPNGDRVSKEVGDTEIISQ
jgi:hypothetical protein